MKKLLALVLTVILALASLTAAAETVRYEKYTNKDLGFSVEYPETWMAMDAEMIAMIMELVDVGAEFEGISTEELAQAAANKNMVSFVPMDEGYGNFSVDVNELGTYLPASLLVYLLCPEVVGQLNAYMPGLKVISSGDVVNANGESFAHIHVTYRMDGELYHSEQYYVCNGTELVTLTLTAPETEYNEMQEIVMHALKTLSFR